MYIREAKRDKMEGFAFGFQMEDKKIPSYIHRYRIRMEFGGVFSFLFFPFTCNWLASIIQVQKDFMGLFEVICEDWSSGIYM